MKKEVLAALLTGAFCFFPFGVRSEESKPAVVTSANTEMQSISLGTGLLKRETIYSEVVVPLKESIKAKSITSEELANRFATLISLYEGNGQDYWKRYSDVGALELFVAFYGAELDANYAYRLREEFEWDKFPEEEAWSALGNVLRVKSESYRKAEWGVKKLQEAITIEAKDRISGFSAKLRPSIKRIQNKDGAGIGGTLILDKCPFINDLKIKCFKGNVRVYTSIKGGLLQERLSKFFGKSYGLWLEYEWKDNSYDNAWDGYEKKYSNVLWLCFQKKF